MGYQEIVFDSNDKFLVTGGAGFIGSNLCEALLNKGLYVRCFDNFSTGRKENIEEFLKNPKFELMEGDITDYAACERACDGIRFISHQAAWGSVPRSVEMPCYYGEVNIIGTLNIMEAARKSGTVKRIVYASSSSVYGDAPKLPKKEGEEGNPLSPYALTKKVDELYGKIYTELYGLETIGFRYFNVFGRRQNPEGEYAAVIPKFIKAILEGKRSVIYGDGEQTRDFTYIENVIEANLKGFLAPESAAGHAYNIACGGRISINHLYQEISRLLEKKADVCYEKERAGDVKHGNADITNAKKKLGYEPEWDFDRGLKAAIQWYKENL